MAFINGLYHPLLIGFQLLRKFPGHGVNNMVLPAPLYDLYQCGDKVNTLGCQVKQAMENKVKFGMFGKLMDALMIRKQTDAGIKKFFIGLKQFAESN